MNDPSGVSLYRFTVEWGDCDPADIVYYPNYYRWFDNACHRLFEGAGYALAEVRARGSVGFPLVDASARFRAPAKVGDQLAVSSRVAAIGGRSITVEHTVRRDDTVLVEGREVRIMGVVDVDGRLSAIAIPDDFRRYFGFPAR